MSRDRYSGYPLTIEGFAYLWAGARATHGVTQGRVFYEMKVMAKTDLVSLMRCDGLRVFIILNGGLPTALFPIDSNFLLVLLSL